MAISELIKYEGNNDTFIWKYPNEDFNFITELVVHENQEAVFMANGKAADRFGPGRYKLDAKNIPILTDLLDLVTGVAVFHCEVYFINKSVQMALKWGTDSKIRLIEPTLGVPLEIGASGEMNLAVYDGLKLLVKLVGTTRGIAWGDNGEGFTKSLQDSFRSLISTAVKSSFPAAIKRNNIDIVEVDEHLSVLSEDLRVAITPGFEEYGLTIPQFYVTAVILPEDDPNFKRLKELHTVNLQKQMATAEADVRITQAQSRASYMTAEAAADAQITAAQRGVVLEEQTTETEIAKREAERKLIQAQADAQITQMSGMAEAAVMQAKGYNQKDVLQADVQKAYAEGIGNMGPEVSNGGGGNSVMGDMIGLGVSMAAMNAMVPQVGEMMKGMDPARQNQTTATGQVAGNASATATGQVAGNAPAAATGQTTGTIQCPSCGKELPANAKFCLECGTSIINKCPNCGAEVPTGGKFCLECGTKL